ncbi:uncharacterized protein LOC113513355 [Galleria mellonella]|uniref:Uncharacterized protein LOC113513355 n=1 Tax=Galleria mellonella TaxID=7137 RepID=A0A6J3BZ90_GALME|nr:uncharacterized protein LOC113513355 [Galleria mellonella]
MKFELLFLVCFTLIGKTVGQFRCYACSFSSTESDQSCLTITDDTPTVECTSTFCTIFRQEYVDPSGVVASFIRTCEAAPDYLNHDIVDSTFRTYYRACTQDLCNIGDGVQSVVGGGLSPTPEYTGTNLLIPGIGRGNATKHKITLVTYIMTLCATMLVYN